MKPKAQNKSKKNDKFSKLTKSKAIKLIDNWAYRLANFGLNDDCLSPLY